MTREVQEAIKQLKAHAQYYLNASDLSALNIVIEALQQETSECKAEDCISREQALRINELHHGSMPNHINHQIWEELRALPSVYPKSDKPSGNDDKGAESEN